MPAKKPRFSSPPPEPGRDSNLAADNASNKAAKLTPNWAANLAPNKSVNKADNWAPNRAAGWAYPLGFWSAGLTTLGGVIYFAVILRVMLSGQFTFPPSPGIQLFGGISSLLFCPFLVTLMACLHTVTPAEKKVFSQVSLGFTLLFALAVSINRYTQLGVVRQSVASGTVPGVDWFLPYGDHSIMLGLEMMGWGWFLGLALLFAAPLFSQGKLQLWLRGLMVLYAVLGLTSSTAYLLASPLSVIGFAAWGLVLFIITALLALYFRQTPI